MIFILIFIFILLHYILYYFILFHHLVLCVSFWPGTWGGGAGIDRSAV